MMIQNHKYKLSKLKKQNIKGDDQKNVKFKQLELQYFHKTKIC